MSHFYGTLQGNKGGATRCGSKDSGMVVTAAGWQGAVTVDAYQYKGVDLFKVCLHPWENSGGKAQIIAAGALNARTTHQRDVKAETVAKVLREMSAGNPECAVTFAAAMLDLSEAFEADNSDFDTAAFLQGFAP